MITNIFVSATISFLDILLETTPQIYKKKITEKKSDEVNSTSKAKDNALGTTKISQLMNATRRPLFSISTPEIVNEVLNLESDVEQRITKLNTITTFKDNGK